MFDDTDGDDGDDIDDDTDGDDGDDIDTRPWETERLWLILLTRDLQHFYKVKSAFKV